MKPKKYDWAKKEKLRQSTPDINNEELLKKYYGEDINNIPLRDKINDFIRDYKSINSLCKKMKVEPFYVVIGAGVFFSIVLILSIIFLGKYITFFISTFYPLYKSFKVLQYFYMVGNSKKADAETIKWLSYWLFYAFITNFECLLGYFIQNLRFYMFIKVLLIFLCFLPQVELNLLIYNYVTKQIYGLYGEKIENYTKSFVRNFSSEVEKLEYSKRFKTGPSLEHQSTIEEMIRDSENNFNRRKKIE